MKTRKAGISKKIFIMMLLLIIISDFMLCNMAYLRSRDAMMEQVRIRALSIVECMASNIDGDLFDTIGVGDEESEAYKSILNEMIPFRDYGGIEYAYTVKNSGSGAVYMVDADPDEPAAIGDPFDDDSAELAQAMTGENVMTAKPYKDEWGEHLTAYAPFRNSKGEISGLAAVDISTAELNAKQRALLINIIILFIVIVGISIVLLTIIRNMLNRGFSALNEEVENLVRGDGDMTKKINLDSGDEFEIIAGNMNAFIDQIRDVVNGVKGSANDTFAYSGTLTASVQSATGTMGNLSNAIDEVAHGATQQAQEVSDASSDVAGIVDRLSEMEDTVNNAEQFTQKMNENSHQVSGRFDILIQSIQSSLEELDLVTKEMDTVGTSVKTVIEAANAIDSIARQTNLLSLNASIEAARAGEAGKGFAVVAGEIGSLATQSNESASAIKKIMDELTKETKKAIESVNKLNDVMKQQGSISEESQQSLMTLFDDIEQTRQTFGIIRDNVSGIQEACGRLNDSINNLSAISEENAASAQETAASITQIMNVINDVNSQADSIRKLSSGLEDAVNKYRT